MLSVKYINVLPLNTFQRNSLHTDYNLDIEILLKLHCKYVIAFFSSLNNIILTKWFKRKCLERNK